MGRESSVLATVLVLSFSKTEKDWILSPNAFRVYSVFVLLFGALMHVLACSVISGRRATKSRTGGQKNIKHFKILLDFRFLASALVCRVFIRSICFRSGGVWLMSTREKTIGGIFGVGVGSKAPRIIPCAVSTWNGPTYVPFAAVKAFGRVLSPAPARLRKEEIFVLPLFLHVFAGFAQ